MNKILIWTYNPYKHYKVNSAKVLVEQLSDKYEKVVLDADYNLDLLFQAIQKFKPDLVMGIGQTYKKIVKVERTFTNKVGNQKGELYSTLPVKKMAEILNVEVSDNAGEYNCNFSAYKLLEQVNLGNIQLKIGFIHIPSKKYFRNNQYFSKFQELLNFLEFYEFEKQ